MKKLCLFLLAFALCAPMLTACDSGTMSGMLYPQGYPIYETDTHVCVFDQQNTDAVYLKSEATESAPAEYYFSCTCGEKGIDAFPFGEALETDAEDTSSSASEGLSFRHDDEEMICSVVGYTGAATHVVIPAVYEGAAVVRIADNAFKNNSIISSVVIPEGVTEIGQGAFENCSNLTSIVIPDSIVSIEGDAFRYTNAIQTATLPISALSAVSKTNLETVVLSSGTSLESRAFSSCSKLKSVTLPSELTSIGFSAFENCSLLASIEIPDGVTSVGDYAFYNCASLESVTASASVVSVGSYVFYGCTKIQTANVSAAMVSTLPQSMKKISVSGGAIGALAFYGFNALEEVVLSTNVKSIGYAAFYDCASLKKISYEGTKSAWTALSKDAGWATNAPRSLVVSCSDGTATK